MNMLLTRTEKTNDGIKGNLLCGDLQEVTIENLEHSFSSGIYDVTIDKSPRLGIFTPHIRVPDRDQAAGGDAGIRIHPANYPEQLLGCIAVGDKAEYDAVDHSKDAFARLMTVLEPLNEPITITVNEAYNV
jgi:Family of unknown function (DUF5675)